MSQIIITRGLPASGKTTWARSWVAKDPATRIRANRDDLRASLFAGAGVLDYAGEQAVSAAQVAIVRSAISTGRSVVIDDTNLRLKFARAWADLARDLGAEFSVQDFLDVPLADCIRRDAIRIEQGSRGVGASVIESMHMKFLNGRTLPAVTATDAAPECAPSVYVPDEGLPAAWLVDIDGTLALMKSGGRGPFDWSRVGEDDRNAPVVQLVCAVADRVADIVIMSGRDEICRPETEAWLTQALGLGGHSALHMRPTGDTRKDSVVKRELFDPYVAPNWNVLGVIDDRQQVVDMWRSMGLMCAQVAPGNF